MGGWSMGALLEEVNLIRATGLAVRLCGRLRFPLGFEVWRYLLGYHFKCVRDSGEQRQELVHTNFRHGHRFYRIMVGSGASRAPRGVRAHHLQPFLRSVSHAPPEIRRARFRARSPKRPTRRGSPGRCAGAERVSPPRTERSGRGVACGCGSGGALPPACIQRPASKGEAARQPQPPQLLTECATFPLPCHRANSERVA